MINIIEESETVDSLKAYTSTYVQSGKVKKTSVSKGLYNYR